MIGFELEAFLTRDGNFILVPPGLPRDECGYLIEFRGKPGESAREAAGLLEAEIDRVTSQLPPDVALQFVPLVKLPQLMLREALRRHGKPPNPVERGSLLGRQYQPSAYCRAGLHIHFTTAKRHITCPKCQHEFEAGNACQTKMVQIIQSLDKRFAEQIKAAKRIPGLFETGKYHGGFEYRSLPSGMDVWEVAEFIDKEVSSLL